MVMVAAGEAGGEGGKAPGPEPDEVALEHVHVVVVDVANWWAPAADEEQLGPGCRICHLTDGNGDGPAGDGEVGELPERLVTLGCGCRGELAAAHHRCAEAWFYVRGNRRCEICGENAMNITGGGGGGMEFIRQWQDTAAVDGGGSSNACGGFCRSQSFCNFLIALLIIAFLLPWFFHNYLI